MLTIAIKRDYPLISPLNRVLKCSGESRSITPIFGVPNKRDVAPLLESFRRAIKGTVVDHEHIGCEPRNLIQNVIDVIDFVVNRQCSEPSGRVCHVDLIVRQQ
jgi:hypothetical protein